jgi:hypothetical protein
MSQLSPMEDRNLDFVQNFRIFLALAASFGV